MIMSVMCGVLPGIVAMIFMYDRVATAPGN